MSDFICDSCKCEMELLSRTDMGRLIEFRSVLLGRKNRKQVAFSN